MSKVLAKFRVTNVEDAKYAVNEGAVNLVLTAVQGEPFGPATTNGYITMTIQNPAAAQSFKDAYEAYLAQGRAWQEADAATRGGYPLQPEFYVTFKHDDGTGSD